MAALPTVGASTGTWGTELNEYLGVEHDTDGTHKAITGTTGTFTGAMTAPSYNIVCYENAVVCYENEVVTV